MTEIKLITVGLGDYPNEPAWKVDAADDCRRRIEKLLTDHGVLAEDWTTHATRANLPGMLDDWTERTGSSHVLYWVGHGEYSDFGFRLALADSTAPLKTANAFTGSTFTETIRDHLARRGDDPEWLLVIIDACGSGDALTDLWSPLRRPRNVGIIATTESGAAYAGTFVDKFEDALAGFTGNDTDGIPISELVRRLSDAGNPVEYSFPGSDARLPHRRDVPPPAQATVADYAELAAALKSAPPKVRNHFYAKAQGAEISEPAWYFTGRTTEREKIATWLKEADEGLFVVTGVAGSGKSAALGMMLASSEPAITQALEHAGHEPIPEALRTEDLSYDAVVHLRGHTIGETISLIGDALQLDSPPSTTDELVAALRQRNDPRRLTMLIDALDESRDPLTIATLLRQLASAPATRLLVGTRQSLHEDPDHPEPPDEAVLTALGADPDTTLKLERDPDAVREYVTRRLTKADLSTGMTVEEIAELIAEKPQPFLFARLAVHEIIARPEWAASPVTLRPLLTGGHSGIFGRAVERFATTAPKVEALVHALTYARGNGFPRTGGIWAIAANAISDEPINDTDVRHAIQLAAPYIMIDSEFGDSTYRLAHRTFVEWYLHQDRS